VAAAARPDIKAFTHFYLSPENKQYVTQVGYVPLPAATLAVQTTRFDSGVKGSALGGHGSVLGVHMDLFSVDEEEKIKAQLVQ
jgi:phosphate transport system substrate-binding protein